MRRASVLQTKPVGKGQNYVYSLRVVSPKAVAAQIGTQPE